MLKKLKVEKQKLNARSQIMKTQNENMKRQHEEYELMAPGLWGSDECNVDSSLKNQLFRRYIICINIIESWFEVLQLLLTFNRRKYIELQSTAGQGAANRKRAERLTVESESTILDFP